MRILKAESRSSLTFQKENYLFGIVVEGFFLNFLFFEDKNQDREKKFQVDVITYVRKYLHCGLRHILKENHTG